MNDPVEDFLQHPPSLPSDAALRQSLADQTAAMVRRPRSWRRWPVVAAVAASIILAAVAAGYFGFRSRSDEPVVIVAVHEPKPPPPVVEPKTPTSPRDLEWTAFDAQEDAQRARLYFQAGDLYLDQHHDYESAVRCYQQALDCCNAHELEFNPDDNWLVMALKRDHRKEN